MEATGASLAFESRQMNTKKVGLAAGAVATLGVALVGGNAIADVASSKGSDGAATAAYGYTAPDGDGGHGFGGRGGHDHTRVTGAELTRVKDAVKAEDPDVTVETVQQDPDGSYDVFGTKGGAPVMLEVSADLATVTERSGGPGRGFGDGDGGPGSADTPVTGAELTKVTSAVEKNDSAVTVQSVRKDPDGSYDVSGTKGGAPVMLEVSKDLKTITENAGGGHRGGSGGPGVPDAEGAQPSAPSSQTGFLQS